MRLSGISLFLILGLSFFTSCEFVEASQSIYEIQYDVIVAGTGGGASEIIKGLSQKSNLKVLVIETGTYADCQTCHNSIASPASELLFTTHDPRLFTTTNFFGRHTEEIRAYIEGGSTSIYGALSVPPSKQLLDNYFPHDLRYEIMLPFIRKTQDHYCHWFPASITGISDTNCTLYHGKNGPLEINPTYNVTFGPATTALINGVAEEGIPYKADYAAGNREEGIYLTQFFRSLANRTDRTSHPARENAWNAYVENVYKTKHNVKFLWNHRVDKVLFKKQNGVPSAYAVQVRTDEGKLVSIKGKKIILATGVFDTPLILQRSGVGDAALLNKFDIPVVVNNTYVGKLMNHMAFTMTHSLNTFEAGDLQYNTYDTYVIFLKSDKDNTQSGPNIEIEVLSGIYLNGIDTGLLGAAPELIPYLERLATGQSLPFMSYIVTLLNTTAEGTVTIGDKLVDTKPIIDYGWNPGVIAPGTQEYAALKYAYDFIVRLGSANNSWGQQFVTGEAFPGDIWNLTPDPVMNFYYFLSANVHSIYHGVGTARIGKVVDTRGRVLGVRNLIACDNSVPPVLIDANPTQFLYAFSRLVLEILLQDL